MPWIYENLCEGCGTCVDYCRADAITMTEQQKARIDDGSCIRCGTCHDVCPEGAVRHDGERVPLEIAADLEEALRLLSFFDTADEKQGLVTRLVRHFRRKARVAGEAATILENLGDAPDQELKRAVDGLHQKWEETLRSLG